MRRWSSVVCYPATEGRGRKTKLDIGLSAPNSGTRHGTGLQAGRGWILPVEGVAWNGAWLQRGRGLEFGGAPARGRGLGRGGALAPGGAGGRGGVERSAGEGTGGRPAAPRE